jgi:hypothetical protein
MEVDAPPWLVRYVTTTVVRGTDLSMMELDHLRSRCAT